MNFKDLKDKEIVEWILVELDYLRDMYFASTYDYEGEAGDVCQDISDNLKELIDNIKNRIGEED